MTPYTWRNFVTGASTAREGQMGRFFLQKRHFIHKLSVKKQETGQKTGKNPPKKGVFISPSDQLLWPGHESCQLWWPGHESWQLWWPRPRKLATLVARPRKLPTLVARPPKLATLVAWLGQLVRGADKNTFFWRFFARFLSCFLLFHRQFVYNTDILKKNRTQLAFFSRRDH